MPIIKHFRRLEYIDYMIKQKATGDLSSFAKKNGLSKATLCEIIRQMKEMGFPIKYNRNRKTYYYEENGEMIKTLFLKYGEVLAREQVNQISQSDKLCFSPKSVFRLCDEQ